MNTLLKIDNHRRALGFMSVDEILALSERGNHVFDPFSLLISLSVEIGTRNTFYPNVVIACGSRSTVRIGDGNIFHMSTYLRADLGGEILVRNGTEFGDGCFSAIADRAVTRIEIGSGCRFTGGVRVFGNTSCGDGSQVHGAINVLSCVLAAGGTFEEPDPDERGAVLKGHGVARNLHIGKGEVIAGVGNFDQGTVVRQRTFHP